MILACGVADNSPGPGDFHCSPRLGVEPLMIFPMATTRNSCPVSASASL